MIYLKNKIENMKTRFLMLLAFVVVFAACENQENDFDDFGSTAVYFPFQTPARTIIQGRYDLGINENDNNQKFEISLTMGGVFTNDVNRRVGFRLAPELLSDVENVTELPQNYYTIETESPVTIPSGSIKGKISVQLTDAFFDDPLSFAGDNDVHYVVPLKITNYENLDSLLTGVKLVDNPIKIRDEDWDPLPKDYTLFGIKFMNEYQGIYLRRGADVMTNGAGEVTTSEYRAEFIERDELTNLTTTGRSNVSYINRVRRGELNSPGDVSIELLFSSDDTCTVVSSGDDPYNVSGSGRFVEDGDEWGGERRNVIYLDYTYTDAVNSETHAVRDTLVIRNRDVKFEEFTVELTGL